MKRIAVVWYFVACCSVMAQTNSLTVDGFTYDNPRFERITTNTVTIFHSTGVATIPLAKLPIELQHQLGYDPVKLAQEDAARNEAAAKAEAAAEAPLKGQELTAWKCALDYLVHTDPYLKFSGNHAVGNSLQTTPTGDYLFTFGGRGKNPEDSLGASSDSVVEINVTVSHTNGDLRVERVFYK